MAPEIESAHCLLPKAPKANESLPGNACFTHLDLKQPLAPISIFTPTDYILFSIQQSIKKPSRIPQTASNVLQAPLPDLSVGRYHTTSPAIHRLEFVGSLVRWTTFETDVINAIQPSKGRLDRIIISHGKRVNIPEYYLSKEQVRVGDEHGVQGRYQQNVGQVVTATLRVGGVTEKFADYTASSSTRSDLLPDLAIIGASTCDIHAVGEVKVPWVNEHDLSNITTIILKFNRALGQIARYMHVFKLKYGFLTTYNHTIFLKQEVTATGVWELHYSSVIQHDSVGNHAIGRPSLRECHFGLAVMASNNGHPANNTTPMRDWVRKLKTRD